jgi:very-short-patch-repair endonuclease
MVAALNQPYAARTTTDDERRYNVAMSRARDQAWLFHSVTLADLSPSDMRHRLLTFFQGPAPATIPECDIEKLRLAVRGHRTLENQPPPFDSWFEVDVCLALLERGFSVQPQVEVGYKRIDLVIEGTDGRLAVECDGEFWHGPDAFADDMVRQRQLERAGWTFERVRESAFYADRQAAIDKVVAACLALDVRPWSPEGSATKAPPEDSSIVAMSLASGPSEEGPASDAIDAVVPGDAAPEEDDGPAEANESGPAEIRDEAVPFSGYSSACGFPDPREASPANIRTHVLEIITRDGPLLRSSVAKLYLRGCPGVSRLGKEIERTLTRAIGGLISIGAIVLENELRPGDPDGQVVRLTGAPPVRSRPAGQRSLEEIPPSELLKWLEDRRPTTGELFPDNRDACCRYLLERAGGQAMTLSKRKHLEKILSFSRRPPS